MTNGYLLNVGEEATAWATTPTGIATVNTAVNSKGNLHADNLGTTSVTGTFFGNTTNLDFIVGDPIVKSCAITPTSGSLIYFPSYTDSLQFTVTATFTDNSKLEYTQNAATSFFKYVDATSSTLSGVGSWGTGVNKGRLYSNTAVSSPTNVYIGATVGSIRCTPCGSGDAACPTPVTARPIVTISPATVADYYLQVANRGCFESVVIPTVSVNTSIFLKGCIKWSNGSIQEDFAGPSTWTSPQPTLLAYAGLASNGGAMSWARFNALAAGQPVTVTAQKNFGGSPPQIFNPTMTIPLSSAPITAVSITGPNHKSVLAGSVCAQFGNQYEFCELGVSIPGFFGPLQYYQTLGTRAGLPPQDLTLMATIAGTTTGCTAGGMGADVFIPATDIFGSYAFMAGFTYVNTVAGSAECDGELTSTVTFVDNTTMSNPAGSATARVFSVLPAAGLTLTVTPNALTGAGKFAHAVAIATSKIGNVFVPFDLSLFTDFTTDTPQAIWMNTGYSWFDVFEHGDIISRAVSAATPVKIFGDYLTNGTQIGQTTLTINP
jgi:hypothetical protein